METPRFQFLRTRNWSTEQALTFGKVVAARVVSLSAHRPFGQTTVTGTLWRSAFAQYDSEKSALGGAAQRHRRPDEPAPAWASQAGGLLCGRKGLASRRGTSAKG